MFYFLLYLIFLFYSPTESRMLALKFAKMVPKGKLKSLSKSQNMGNMDFTSILSGGGNKKEESPEEPESEYVNKISTKASLQKVLNKYTTPLKKKIIPLLYVPFPEWGKLLSKGLSKSE